MIRNNVELKHGDYICGCAVDYDGYHYLHAFALYIDKVENNVVKGTFHGASYDDGVIHYYCTNNNIENINSLNGYNICIVDKQTFENYLQYLQEEDIDEFDIWDYFESIFKTSKMKIVEYTQEDFL